MEPLFKKIKETLKIVKMRTLVILLLLILTSFNLSAQEWQTDFTKAKEIANQEHKKILLVFQGSDWCAPCIKLDRKIWNSEKFKTYAKDHFVMLKADFPRRKKNKLSLKQEENNKNLAAKYNSKGYFPLVVVLDDKGSVLGQLGYKNIKPTAYIKLLSSF